MWAGIASWLLYWRRGARGAHTLLLITVASQATGYGLKVDWLLLAPFRADRSVRNQVSAQLEPDTRLPRLGVLGQRVPDQRLRSGADGGDRVPAVPAQRVGIPHEDAGPQSPHRSAGRVSTVKYGTAAMLISGACAGLAGAMMLSGGDFGNYRFTPGFATNIGWEGLLVALVARSHPVGIVIVAFSFAGLRAGSGFLAATGSSARSPRWCWPCWCWPCWCRRPSCSSGSAAAPCRPRETGPDRWAASSRPSPTWSPTT